MSQTATKKITGLVHHVPADIIIIPLKPAQNALLQAAKPVHPVKAQALPNAAHAQADIIYQAAHAKHVPLNTALIVQHAAQQTA